MKGIWRIVIVLGMVLAGLTGNFRQAHAEYGELNCYASPCQILGAKFFTYVKEQSQIDKNKYWYLINGANIYQYYLLSIYDISGYNESNLVGQIPFEVIIPRNSDTSVPQMGLFWRQDQLITSAPGGYIGGESLIPMPAARPKVTITTRKEIAGHKEYNPQNQLVSYSYAGSELLTWYFIPEINEAKVILHIIKIDAGYLTPTNKVPVNLAPQFNSLDELDIYPGEELTVTRTIYTTEIVPLGYYFEWKWEYYPYDEYYQRLLKEGVNEDVAAIKTTMLFQTDVRKNSQFYQYYDNTTWQFAYTMIAGFEFERASGDKFAFTDRVIARRACTPDEYCSTTSSLPAVNRKYYAEQALFDKADGDYLHLIDVYPGLDILPRDQEVLDKRVKDGQVRIETAVIESPVPIDRDGNGHPETFLIGTDKGSVDLPAMFSPPLGTEVTIYYYQDDFHPKYENWKVMALFDEAGKLWYFNTMAEYGFSFEPETYSLDQCGSEMTLDLWMYGCP
jgi:hypothetical protein